MDKLTEEKIMNKVMSNIDGELNNRKATFEDICRRTMIETEKQIILKGTSGKSIFSVGYCEGLKYKEKQMQDRIEKLKRYSTADIISISNTEVFDAQIKAREYSDYFSKDDEKLIEDTLLKRKFWISAKKIDELLQQPKGDDSE